MQPSQEVIPVRHLGAWDLCQYDKCKSQSLLQKYNVLCIVITSTGFIFFRAGVGIVWKSSIMLTIVNRFFKRKNDLLL